MIKDIIMSVSGFKKKHDELRKENREYLSKNLAYAKRIQSLEEEVAVLKETNNRLYEYNRKVEKELSETKTKYDYSIRSLNEKVRKLEYDNSNFRYNNNLLESYKSKVDKELSDTKEALFLSEKKCEEYNLQCAEFAKKIQVLGGTIGGLKTKLKRYEAKND